MSKNFSPWYTVIEVGKVQCKLCNCIFCKKPTRMLSHLGYEGPSGSRDKTVSLCSKLTSSIRSLFAHGKGGFPQKPIADTLDGNEMPIYGEVGSSSIPTSRSTQEDSCTARQDVIGVDFEGTPISRTGGENETLRRSGTRHSTQSGLLDGFQETKKRRLHAMWANFFYAANIPFSVARNPIFKDVVKMTAEYNGPYSPPAYHDLRNKLLQEAKIDVMRKLESRTKDSIRKFGATLSIDGWSSVTNRPLINAMLVSCAGEQFLGSVDTSGEKKTAPYIAAILEQFIEEIGPKNVVQVTADNTNANPAAWNLVSHKYPHMYFQGCVVHALNLLLKDWGSQKWIKDSVKKAEVVANFFKKRHMPLAIFRKYETKLSLLKPLKTRFASYFIMIDRLLEVMSAVKQSVVDPQWIAYVNTLNDNDKGKSRTLSRIVSNTVLSEHCWDRWTNVREMTAPIVYALRDLDAKTPCMGKVLHIMRSLQKHVFGLRFAPFSLNADRATPLETSFLKRRKMGETDLHYAAALLNPYLLHDKELADDYDATEACKRVIMKICDREDYAKVVKEFVAFRHREPPFHNMLEPGEQMLSAHAWWDFEGACGKLIAPIAKRILAQPVSSSSCERNWSSYSYVHNKSRNKLTTVRAAELVYVYTNSRVVAASTNKDEKKWYRDNVDSDDSEPGSDSDGDIDGPHELDGEANDNHVNDWLDSTYHSPNRSNGHSRGDDWDLYDFHSDEETDGYRGEDPPLARFVDGTGYMNSDNVLAEKEAALAAIDSANVTTLINSGNQAMDENIHIREPPSTEGVRDEENEVLGCDVNVEENVHGTNVQSMKELADNDHGEETRRTDKPNEEEKDGDECLVELESQCFINNGKEKVEVTQGSQRLPRSPPLTVLFPSTRKTGDASRISDIGNRLLNIPKNNQPSIRRSHPSVLSTDDDMDETLEAMFIRKSCSSAPPRRNMKSSFLTPQASDAIKIVSHGGPSSEKREVKQGGEGKKRRIMEPFAISPKKRQKVCRTPLDACLPVEKTKIKPVPCPSKDKQVALMKVKMERTNGTRKKLRTSTEVADKGCTLLYSSSDDIEDTSDEEDKEWRKGAESSGAEVKGDDDYCP